MDWFIKLSEEDQQFVKEIILTSGSLKELAKVYDVSYPTVRLRMDRLIEKINLFSNNQENNFRASVMKLVIDEKISLEIGKEILKNYERFEKE
ncbi:DUF2089 family protein [Vagococcus sp.]|uniref:DUF2089 family protein n=1 Tax=Vagococcus sp. TaxID=1933889 RepID=UPI003F960DC7